MSASSQIPTALAEAGSSASRSGRGIAPSLPRDPAFAPGQVLASRYRIVGLLGSGGMGEVFRADDLKLGTAVALKFLPRESARDTALLERFHAEVRNARQVSHPHVCRVHDIGETDGRHFLCMEYVDGEDLATLLRRIGRLPPAKAVEIARQLAAGLAAAHEKGVLHRDLKPANVMIDGHGRARITDFGLAVLSGEAAAEIAGTPAYMSPEQLAGRPATVQSDLYALGLVLYELFTGKRTFEAGSVAEWKRVHAEAPPTSPSLHTGDMDPAVERLILRCLEKDPSLRPRSAAQVALALPGGDPLAAALAAGDTPSPEMVAAAGGEGGLVTAGAWAALGAFFLVLVATIAISPASTDLGLAPMEQSPDSLRDRAREIVRNFEYVEAPVDEATWLERDYGPIRWLADNVTSTDWRRRLHEMGAPVLLCYRRSERQLLPVGAEGLVTRSNPAADLQGEILVVVDSRRRLRELRAVPPRWSGTRPAEGAFPEDAIFREAGLDRDRFEPVPPEWVPPVAFDQRREWSGTRVEAPEIRLRLCAATFEGKVVSVAVLGPWQGRDSIDPLNTSVSRQISQATLALFIVFVVAIAGFFARRNLRLGRGDRRGATRIALACLLLGTLGWLASAHPVREWDELVLSQLLPAMGAAFLLGMMVWLSYVALEPYVRRRMPDLLVGWARVLEGRIRDPRVGRDVLLGTVLGVTLATVLHFVNGLPTWVPFAKQTTIPLFRSGGLARLDPLAAPVDAAIGAIVRTLTILTLLFSARIVISRRWLLLLVLWVVSTGLALGAENPLLETPSSVLMGFVIAFTAVRLGPLALGAMWFSYLLLGAMPVRASLSTWYAPHAFATLAVLIGLALWSFRAALGGRSPFGAVSLDA